jgi:sugar phosphate isomerase/epimerase
VFPGEGVHSDEIGALVRRLDDAGYRGDYSFEVFNDDYKQLPLAMVSERARASVRWTTGVVSRRSLPARRRAGMG